MIAHGTKLTALRRLIKNYHAATYAYAMAGSHDPETQEIIVADYKLARTRLNKHLTKLESTIATQGPNV